jgi:F420-0:gamma-glutamyl ligase
LNLPPYDKWATKSPVDPQGAAERIAAAVHAHTGCRVGVAVIDANDMAAEVFATTGPARVEDVLACVADNPLGQSDQQTPFGLVRRMPERVPQAVPEPVAAAV